MQLTPLTPEQKLHLVQVLRDERRAAQLDERGSWIDYIELAATSGKTPDEQIEGIMMYTKMMKRTL